MLGYCKRSAQKTTVITFMKSNKDKSSLSLKFGRTKFAEKQMECILARPGTWILEDRNKEYRGLPFAIWSLIRPFELIWVIAKN